MGEGSSPPFPTQEIDAVESVGTPKDNWKT